MNQPAIRTRAIALADLSQYETYLLLRDAVIPRPIAWVSTVDEAGRSNLAPFSFFNICSPEPPILGFGVAPRPADPQTGRRDPKDTLANVRATGEMVVNIVPEELADPMVQTGTGLPPGDSEFAFAGLHEVASERVRAPRVLGAPVAFECVLHEIVDAGLWRWVMARVVVAHVDERIYLGEVDGLRHRIDLTRVEALRPLARLGRAQYSRLRAIETHTRADRVAD